MKTYSFIITFFNNQTGAKRSIVADTIKAHTHEGAYIEAVKAAYNTLSLCNTPGYILQSIENMNVNEVQYN